KSLQDLGLQGGIEVVLGAITGVVNFDVVVDGVTKSVSVNPGSVTDLTSLANEVNLDLGVGAKVKAVIEKGRLSLKSVDDAVQNLTFKNVNSVAQAALGFANDQAGIPFFDFINFQQFESAVNDFLPGFTIKYDNTSHAVTFDLALSATYARDFHLNFGRDIS